MNYTVEVPHDATPEELREAADEAERLAEHLEGEAQRFHDLAAHLRVRYARGETGRTEETGT